MNKSVHVRGRVPGRVTRPFRHDEFHITPMVITSPIPRNAAPVGFSTYSPNCDSWPAVNARYYSYRSSHRSYRFFRLPPTYGNGFCPISAQSLPRRRSRYLRYKYTKIFLFFHYVYKILGLLPLATFKEVEIIELFGFELAFFPKNEKH